MLYDFKSTIITGSTTETTVCCPIGYLKFTKKYFKNNCRPRR